MMNHKILVILTVITLPVSPLAQASEKISAKKAISAFKNLLFGDAKLEGDHCTISLIGLEGTSGGVMLEIENSNGRRMSASIRGPSTQVWLTRNGYNTRYEILNSSETLGTIVDIHGFEDSSSFDLTLVNIASGKAMVCSYQE